ncbi:imidazoleglycerol-phosphate dehydratase HisB [Thermorudis peleae]|uniref:imidazoleglycerol-phosphate dehydratase HisB n=1 Tax=Thermorudis peleae TaxID=1382356 RepID=UPI00056ED4D6|nr:imidazoleglycerol-phosphate dehydratase HisB [Thermorudis peleae]
MTALRRGVIQRETTETRVAVEVLLDGRGTAMVQTGIGALDHVLTLFAKHGRFDLTIEAKGDLHIDAHHTTEDVAICLGQAFKAALGDHRGIVRMGNAAVPMDEALAHVAVDCSGRGYFVMTSPFVPGMFGLLDADLVRHFLESFAYEARINVHILTLYGTNLHHQVEAVFKALGRALDQATQRDARIQDTLPSTKGYIETT